MRDEILIGTAGTITSAVGTVIQLNDVLKTISMIFPNNPTSNVNSVHIDEVCSTASR